MVATVLAAILLDVDRCKRCPRDRAPVLPLLKGGGEPDISGRCEWCRKAIRTLAFALGVKVKEQQMELVL